MGSNPLGKREDPGIPRIRTYTSTLSKVTIKDPRMPRVRASQVRGQRNSAIPYCSPRETPPATSKAREVSSLILRGLRRREVTCARVMPTHKSAAYLRTLESLRVIRCFMRLSAPKYSISKLLKVSPRFRRVLTEPLLKRAS